ncbi:metal ABC transporter substrate-binding protein [Anaeromyxobacter diazotrophicus]|uniref:Zinc ABC transporter substrate-binding protein n=1 Tax=Anaeromyxobacter diazotrophicus TaxID=2590199 RepID=A0A7I9VS46_9BACT|nr:metal ABC transporter substrate-binding protein [Anaeromyxobacter diazotrophicus]GEJ59263.1 zinc ABC transporter substrate-binding protein [Anaeromyxobacter diazotrophicus]
MTLRNVRRSVAARLRLAAVALAVFSPLLPRPAAAALRVVTTTEGLAALVKEAGGDQVQVESLSRGIQDPHFVDANPMLAVKLRQAGLLVDVGLDLEIGWLPPLVNQSRNPDIQPGGARRFTAASAIHVLDIPTGPVDRSLGDLHPAGNPHFMDDPRAAVAVVAGLAKKLAQLDPANAAKYAQRGADFQRRLDADLARWKAALAPLRGRPIVAQHQTMSYFLDWTGLRAVAYLEPKPGVPPPPSHLAEVVQLVKAQGVKAILVENYYDPRSAEVVARHTGAKVVLIPGDVGGMPGTSTYESYLDTLVRLVAGAVR